MPSIDGILRNPMSSQPLFPFSPRIPRVRSSEVRSARRVVAVNSDPQMQRWYHISEYWCRCEESDPQALHPQREAPSSTWTIGCLVGHSYGFSRDGKCANRSGPAAPSLAMLEALLDPYLVLSHGLKVEQGRSCKQRVSMLSRCHM